MPKQKLNHQDTVKGLEEFRNSSYIHVPLRCEAECSIRVLPLFCKIESSLCVLLLWLRNRVQPLRATPMVAKSDTFSYALPYSILQ